MQTVSCPSCGAEVNFRSHASVMAVCEYCNTRVLKEAGAVKDLGKISSVLEDYSPIQVGTSGVLGGRNFNVVGRIQLKYDAGMWNEWYIVFDDATSGWLGDASGQYMVTTLRAPDGNVLPTFEELQPGKPYQLAGERYMAADVRSSRCIGGQGELPFKVGDGWEVKAADFRRGEQFLTIDYSDEGPPLLYTGVAVTLEAMQCQLLRDVEDIKRTTGRYRGKLDALDCPNCGTQIKYLPGMTASLVCQSCHTQIDAASPKAEVIAIGEKQEKERFTLPLGASGKLGNQDFTIIGVMRRADDEGSSWTEYLLYGSRNGFTWLVETEDGWSRANVMDAWPDAKTLGTQSVTADKADYNKLYDYNSVVTYAAGAFNWRVQVGDHTHVYEYRRQQVTLAAELTTTELGWSRSTPVAWDQLKAWFGDAVKGEPRASTAAGDSGKDRYARSAKNWIMGMVALNAIPLLFNFGGTIGITFLAGLALYLPALVLDAMDEPKK
jgi:ribosomal protein S27E